MKSKRLSLRGVFLFTVFSVLRSFTSGQNRSIVKIRTIRTNRLDSCNQDSRYILPCDGADALCTRSFHSPNEESPLEYPIDECTASHRRLSGDCARRGQYGLRPGAVQHADASSSARSATFVDADSAARTNREHAGRGSDDEGCSSPQPTADGQVAHRAL